jgi:hypothetical protein
MKIHTGYVRKENRRSTIAGSKRCQHDHEDAMLRIES